MFNSQKINNNNPNPILEQFREDFTGDISGWYWWLSDVSKDMFYSKECTREHIDHARKVLGRLVSTYDWV